MSRQQKPIKALLAAHKQAHAAHVEARKSLGSHPAKSWPEIYLAFVGARANSHKKIDEIAGAYQKKCARAGRWTQSFNFQRGRMDEHGVFHNLGTGCCPKDGHILVRPKTPPKKFTRESLKEFRAHVASIHSAFKKRVAAMERENRQSGHDAAYRTYVKAFLAEAQLLVQITNRSANGSVCDVTAICGHLARVADECDLREILEAISKNKRIAQ